MNNHNILVLGNGFLGSEFKSHVFKYGEVYQTTRKEFEVTDINSIEHKLDILLKYYNLDNVKIDTIINCIGIADTRFCEKKKNFNIIKLINGDFVGVLSKWCEKNNIKLVHISTGCLYARQTGLVNEKDFIEAHCNYVVSKWIGEMGCNLERDLIIRPRLYFSDKPNKLNLICKFPKFKNILNEFNSVTSTRTIVEAVDVLLQFNQIGVFNVANDGAYTIKQLSEAIGYKWEDNQVVTQSELHKSQGLYLVNNVMDLSKLKQFYTPRDAIEEFKWCHRQLYSKVLR